MTTIYDILRKSKLVSVLVQFSAMYCNCNYYSLCKKDHDDILSEIFSIHFTMGVFLSGLVRCFDYDCCYDLSTQISGQKAVSYKVT